MLIQRTINDKYDIPATRIKKYIDSIIQKQFGDKKSNNFVCQQCKIDVKCNENCHEK